MAPPILSRGDEGDEVEQLQNLLNRVGALLGVDGDFGPATERALIDARQQAGLSANGVADEPVWTWLEEQPEPSADVPTEAVTFIVKEEVSSRAYYERATATPHFPGVESGVTIGIGYDLRFRSPAEFTSDWSDELEAADMNALEPHLGTRGSAAIVESLQSIRVPFAAAWRVFLGKSLPEFVERTRGAFGEFDTLPPLCRGVLVSLVYNRGAGMAGERRAEMRSIRDHIAAGELELVADDLRGMKRLWPDIAGLRKRRDREAELWHKGLGEN